MTDSSGSGLDVEMDPTTRSRVGAPPVMPTPPVDLSVKDTQTVRLVQAMPSATAPGMPYFQGPNVTEFLDRYEGQCKDHHVLGSAMVARLPQHCYMTIAQYVRTIPEWVSNDWAALRVVLCREYREEDTYQMTRTRGFVEAWKKKGCTKGTNLRQFCRQYSTSS